MSIHSLFEKSEGEEGNANVRHWLAYDHVGESQSFAGRVECRSFRASSNEPVPIMISDATVDRYYYIFDSRRHRALVMDRATGEEYAWDTTPRAQLIAYVDNRCSPDTLRHFARWCASQTNAAAAPLHTATGQLWSVSQRDDVSAWRRARQRTVDAVVLAAALGLPKGQPASARLLSVQACTHPEPTLAALDAAHMSERWAEFCSERNSATAARAMRQRHIDRLLDTLQSS